MIEMLTERPQRYGYGVTLNGINIETRAARLNEELNPTVFSFIRTVKHVYRPRVPSIKEYRRVVAVVNVNSRSA